MMVSKTDERQSAQKDLTVRQVADELCLSYWTILSWLKSGYLEHYRYGERNIRIPREEVERVRRECIRPRVGAV